ncbi:hypothetical protein C8R45DRAFT_976443 [Mycena sanguinolenta]|nr:hypothetical protein C8R45DRAFT_976443 [Mycena sanguinolenta]
MKNSQPLGSSRSKSKELLANQHAQRDIAFQQSPDLPLLPLPLLHLYLEDGSPARRVCVDGHEDYTDIRLLTCLIVSHMVRHGAITNLLYILNTLAGEKELGQALRQKLSGRETVEAKDVEEFFTNSTPNFVFKTVPSGDNTIGWGIVNKGDTAEAKRNELFVSLELVNVLIKPRPDGMSDEQFQKSRVQQQLLYVFAVMHELVHCLTKEFFTPIFITPPLPKFEFDAERCHREAGRTFEKLYFGFILEIQIDKKFAKIEHDRFWNIMHIFGRFPRMTIIRACHSLLRLHCTKRLCVILIAMESATKILASLHKAQIWLIESQELATPSSSVLNAGVRFRAGGNGEGEDEVDSESDGDGENVGRNDSTVMVSLGCPPHGVGLGLGIITYEWLMRTCNSLNTLSSVSAASLHITA